MPLKEVNQGLEQITYVGHEGAMDVQQATVTITLVQPANIHGIVTYKSAAPLVAGSTAPRDWTHMILRKRTSDGREFIMEPSGDKLSGIISRKNQYIYDATTREIFVSGWVSTDTYILSCFTTNGSNLAPLSFAESLNIQENQAIRKVFDRKTLDHFKHGRQDFSASLSQKFVDFFEPENVRQLYSPARALTEFYNQEFLNTNFGFDGTFGAVDTFATPFKYAGVDQTLSTRSKNTLRTPAGVDLTEATNLANLQAGGDRFLLSTATAALKSDGRATIVDYSLLTGGKRDSRVFTFGAPTVFGTKDTLTATFDQLQQVLTVNVTAPDTSASTADTLDLVFSADGTADTFAGTFNLNIADTGPDTVSVPITGITDGMTADQVRDQVIIDLNLNVGFTSAYNNAAPNGAGTVRIVRNNVGNDGTLSAAIAAPVNTDVTITNGTGAFVAGINSGSFSIDFQDNAASATTAGPYNVNVPHGSTQNFIALAIHTALSGNLNAGFTLGGAPAGATFTITRTAKGNVNPLTAPVTLQVATNVTFTNSELVPVVAGNIDFNVLYNAVSIITGGSPVNVVLAAADTDLNVASKVHAALTTQTLLAGYTLAAYGAGNSIQITRDVTGHAGGQDLSSTFTPNVGSTVTRPSSIDVDGDDTGTVTIDIFVSGSDPLTVNVTDKMTNDQVATAIASGINTDPGTLDDQEFAVASTGGIVTIYEKGATGAGTGISFNAFVPNGTGITQGQAANVPGVVGSSFTLGTRVFEILQEGLLGNGITVTPGRLPISKGTTNNTAAINIHNAVGTGQTLTGEINTRGGAPAANIVLLESAIGGVAENVSITGQSIAGALTFLGMAGGVNATASVLHISVATGNPLELGSYKLSYQKDSVACAPTLVIRNDVLDCANALLFSEYLAAVTPSTIDFSAPAEDDATMSYSLSVGVKPGNNKDLS